MSRLFSILVLFVILLTACASGPKQIAAYPGIPAQNGPIPGQPVQIYPSQVVYNAYMEMSVPDPERAARYAQDYAARWGGYLSSSQSWYEGGRRNSTLVLNVPAYNFDSLHALLLSLGTLDSEQVTGELTGYVPDGTVNYSQITLHLKARSGGLPPVSFGSWHPLDTVQNAFNVSTSILGFLLDILIWVIVVLGPFALLAWLVYFLVKKARGRNLTPRN